MPFDRELVEIQTICKHKLLPCDKNMPKIVYLTFLSGASNRSENCRGKTPNRLPIIFTQKFTDRKLHFKQEIDE